MVETEPTAAPESDTPSREPTNSGEEPKIPEKQESAPPQENDGPPEAVKEALGIIVNRLNQDKEIGDAMEVLREHGVQVAFVVIPNPNGPRPPRKTTPLVDEGGKVKSDLFDEKDKKFFEDLKISFEE